MAYERDSKQEGLTIPYRPPAEGATIRYPLESARTQAIDAVAQNFPERDWDAWNVYTPKVFLESLPFQNTSVPIYVVTVVVTRPAGMFRKGGTYTFTVQVDAMSGQVIGFDTSYTSP